MSSIVGYYYNGDNSGKLAEIAPKDGSLEDAIVLYGTKLFL